MCDVQVYVWCACVCDVYECVVCMCVPVWVTVDLQPHLELLSFHY